MVDSNRLVRSDLEALALFKLWLELEVSPHAADSAVGHATETWLRSFLERDEMVIGGTPCDSRLVDRARAFVAEIGR